MKAKLPLGKKAKGDAEESEEIEEESDSSQQGDATDATDLSELSADDEDEVSEGPKSLVDKLKALLQKKTAKASADTDAPEDDAAAAAKKKKSKIIQIVVGLGLVVFIFSDEFMPKEEPVPEVQLKPRPKKQPKADQAATDATPPADTTAASQDTPATDAPVTDAPVTETTPDSPVEVTSSDVPTDIPPMDAASTDMPSMDTPSTDTTTADTPSTDLPAMDTPSTSSLDAAPDTSDTDISFDTPMDTVTPSLGTDSIDGNETVTGGEENITDQILQDLENQAKDSKVVEEKKEYITPPDYEYRGRGLVYNCRGKHWACVDGPSYKTCEDNASSVRYLKKKSECYPFNIYESTRGCEVMQNRMVTAAAKTDFCNE